MLWAKNIHNMEWKQKVQHNDYRLYLPLQPNFSRIYSYENHLSTSNDKLLRTFDRGVEMSSDFQKTCKNKFDSLKNRGEPQAHFNFSQKKMQQVG